MANLNSQGGTLVYSDKTICVMGLGYVGLTLAVTLADVGFEVYGIEIRDSVLALLKDGTPHFFEPGMKELLGRVVKRGNLKLFKKIPQGCPASVYIVTVGTPLNEQGVPRIDMVESVTAEIAQNMRPNDLVILRSTVMIGTSRKTVYPILKKSGKDFDLAFCPERTLEGQALKELRELPQIVGGDSQRASIRASQVFQMLTPTVVKVQSLETAEMIKLVDNVNRDVSFAFANEIAAVCDATGVSAMEVISAGKLGYGRTNLPMPGLVGGPCLEKDTYIFAEGLKSFGITPNLSLSARKFNQAQPEEVVSAIKAKMSAVPGFPSEPKITLMGIAFKGRPVTDDLRGTMARPVFQSLKKHFSKAKFHGFDAVVSKSDIQAFGLEPVATLEDAFKGSHLVLICNNHPIFSNMSVEDLVERMARPGLVYDFWNNFKSKDLHFPAEIGFMALGSHALGLMPSSPARANMPASSEIRRQESVLT
jgi:UDP-N-acetyl-D-mannosaminuronic acid dehydrogenase